MLESPVIQTGYSVKSILKHKLEHNMVKRCGKDGCSSDAIQCVHIVLIDQKLLLFHITSAWNHKVMMFLLQFAFFVEHKWYLSDVFFFTSFILL